MNKSKSIDAVLGALATAELAARTPGHQKTIITVGDIDPRVVVDASHTFKTRMYGANAHKTFVHVEYEPYEEHNIKILFISRPLNTLTIRALDYNRS